MFSFEVTKQSKRSRARLGILRTAHGDVETPALVPVATKATVKTLTSDQVLSTKSQLLICNTFHLHLQPGERVVSASGGLHKFMQWPKPLMTDSGGYQVFSLGFGRQLQMGKMLRQKSSERVRAGDRPDQLQITEKGVWFRSPLDGRRIFIGPKESMNIQAKLGADIIFAFDECPPPVATAAYMLPSIERTHRWAEQCLNYANPKQALYGIVQGGKFQKLRVMSAKYIGQRPFAGFGIGGELGFQPKEMHQMLHWVTEHLPADKPRHLLGNGHLEDIPKFFEAGIDTFDCIIPTRYARHGVAFTSLGKIDLRKSRWLTNRKPLDPKCACPTCEKYTGGYVCHLIRANELTGLSLVTTHNVFYFNTVVEKLRRQIKQGKL